ncbi:spore germination protein GerW family protein [Streptomyces sp. NPDC050658]|uniref:spore germination protein GerW family protein n=1 Tax=unclassified Streptomyces TaxID=2593676 RepID=UPI0034211B44
MTAPDVPAKTTPPVDVAAAHASVTPLQRLTEKLGDQASVKVVYGEPVTTDGVTVIPVAEVGFGVGGGIGSKGAAAEGAASGEDGAAGGVRARPRGFIEIRDGAAVYRPIRTPWLDVAVPLAALVVGAAAPPLVRRFLGRRRG